jgi:hypothetical protein
MKRVMLALTALTAIWGSIQFAKADVILDPLHGFCSAGCADNGTNTPILQAPGGTIQNFGFTASGSQIGDLTIAILVPDNDTLVLPGILSTATSPPSSIGTTVQFTTGFGVAGVTDFAPNAAATNPTNPTLSNFLSLTASPDTNLSNYLGATAAFDPTATGYNVVTLTAPGLETLPGPGGTPSPLFDLSLTLPNGSFVVGFLNTNVPGGSMDGVIATANSGALFVTPTLAVPGPIAGAGMPGLVAASLSMLALARRRFNRWRDWRIASA